MAKFCCWTLLICLSLAGSVTAQGMPPSEKLLPDTTKGYLSIPNIETLRAQWKQTSVGQLVDDPVMKPFMEDLRDQIKNKLSGTRLRLGVTIDDLSDVFGGEICLAVCQPDRDTNRHATVLLVDVTDHAAAAKAMLAKVTQSLVQQGAKQKAEKVGGVSVTALVLPKTRPDSPEVEAIYVLHRDVLLATDDRATAAFILARLDKGGESTLGDFPPFAATMARCASEAGAMQPHVRWFVEPIGYAQVLRAQGGGKKKRGADLLKILPNQGFDAIQGVGGHIFVATGEQDILHRTLVYAPPVERAAGGAGQHRYNLAARMLDFPNTDTLQPQPWVSRDLGSYFTFNWKMVEAFEYSKTLVNELLAGRPEDDLLEEIIESLAKDKDGPQVDLRKDLVRYFSERASVVTDCRRPITPESERLLFAIELTNPEAVQQTINKAFEADPDAERREFEGQVIWEIITDDAPADVEAIQIEGAGFDPFAAGGDEEDADEERKILPNSAITVAYGHLLVASHVDFIVDMLKRPLGSDMLTDAADYLQIDDALVKIGSGSDSFRFFTRTDEAYRPTYELIRQGKMPEAKTVVGKVLNRLLGPDEKGILREQQIDGSKMPDFDAVRRYLGPAGVYVRSEDDGWFVAGCLLSKDAP